MKRFARVLRETFVAARPQVTPAGSERVSRPGAPEIDEFESGTAPAPSRRVVVCRYHSEPDLRDQWRCLQGPSQPFLHLTIILELDVSLRSNWRDLVCRRCPADRLVIVPRCGPWPARENFGDLAFASASLGWSLIEIRRDLGEAMEDTVSRSGPDEELLIMLSARAAAGLGYRERVIGQR